MTVIPEIVAPPGIANPYPVACKACVLSPNLLGVLAVAYTLSWANMFVGFAHTNVPPATVAEEGLFGPTVVSAPVAVPVPGPPWTTTEVLEGTLKIVQFPSNVDGANPAEATGTPITAFDGSVLLSNVKRMYGTPPVVYPVAVALNVSEEVEIPVSIKVTVAVKGLG